MIPIIHVNDYIIENGTRIETSFFVFKESPRTKTYCVIGQTKFGDSVDGFSLYLRKRGLMAFVDALYQQNLRVSFLTINAEYLAACPEWSYVEIRRRISASRLHLLEPYQTNDNDSQYDAENFQNYLSVIDYADFESVEWNVWNDWNKYENWDDTYCEACDGRYWKGEDY